MLQRPSDSSGARDVTVLKLRILGIKNNIKAGALSNSYVLINKTNKAARGIFYILYPLYSAEQRGQAK